MSQYLKMWMGTTQSQGVGMGDTGGYSERCFQLIEKLDDLVRSYDAGAEYFELKRIDVAPVIKAVRDLKS